MVFFILGSQSELSAAEISAVLPDMQITQQTGHVLLAETAEKNLSQLQERLAGTVKVGHIIGELPSWDETALTDLIAGYASGAMGKNKISFGISVYDFGGGSATRSAEQEIKNLGGAVKKRLKELERPVRYVSSKEPRLSSVIVEQNGLLPSGGEYCLFVSKEKIVVGQTEAVQDFKAWSARDYGRPGRDAKSGMLPPKLARMMINLSGVSPEGHSLMDPFCGSGTVINEAMLLGYNPLVASDISEKASKDTETNVNWLIKLFDLPEPDVEIHTAPAAELETEPVDVMVMETFLGKPRSSLLDGFQLKKTTQELMPMYESSFKNLFTLLKPDGVCVVAFPAFRMNDRSTKHLPLEPVLESIGFNIRSRHLYQRNDQVVARDIYVLTR